MEAARDNQMRQLYRLHRLSAGAPLAEEADDHAPTTRNDLREFYVAILDGTIERPSWSLPLFV